MYEQEFQGETLYMMQYAVVAALNLVACCYLLFRRANAIAPDVTSPVRLRRWTAVFFAAMTMSHLWYMPSIYLTSSEDKILCYSIGTTTLPVTEGEDFFGPASFHEDDYQFFYNNIKENVAKRIATYKAKQ